jgi:hypothetical protein
LEVSNSLAEFALMMEAVSTSATSVNFYDTTWRNIPENSHIHTRRRENLKSHLGSNRFTASQLLRRTTFGYFIQFNILGLKSNRSQFLPESISAASFRNMS